MRRKYSSFLTILLIVIIIAVIGLLAFLGYQTYTKNKATNDASDAVDSFLSDDAVVNPGNGGTNTQNTDMGDITTEETNTSGGGSSSSTTAKRKTYKGFYMLGTIEIPKTGVKYPVLEKVTKKSLETAVAVIYPFENPELNVPGNVVIVGHNYRNGTFFSNNKRLSNGDKIKITDLNKNTVTYTIYKIFETTETDTTFYNRDTNGKREVTLSTCTDDSSKRIIIQARE